NSTAGSDDFNSAQYGWSHPHHSSIIADAGDNSNSTAGSDDFNSAQYGWSYPHHSSIIADAGDNSNSTDSRYHGWGATQNGSSDTVHLEPLRVPSLTVRP